MMRIRNEMREKNFGEVIYQLETVDATMHVSEEKGVRICLCNTHLMTIAEWMERSPTYCVDHGQGWYLYNVNELMEKVFLEIGVMA